MLEIGQAQDRLCRGGFPSGVLPLHDRWPPCHSHDRIWRRNKFRVARRSGTIAKLSATAREEDLPGATSGGSGYFYAAVVRTESTALGEELGRLTTSERKSAFQFDAYVVGWLVTHNLYYLHGSLVPCN